MSTTHRGHALRRRPFGGMVALVGIVLALVLAVGATASGTTTGNHLFAYVVPATTGPLHVGDMVDNYVYVANVNRPANTFGSRMTLPNAFVVTSIDEKVFVDGVEYGNHTYTPPPDADAPGRAGRWPATVTCPPGTQPPCTTIGSPAVIAGENTVIFYPIWAHGSGEPNGTYIFRYTVHGTYNGTPVDLTATSPPIEMTN
jgi:hypothetical protein